MLYPLGYSRAEKKTANGGKNGADAHREKRFISKCQSIQALMLIFFSVFSLFLFFLNRRRVVLFFLFCTGEFELFVIVTESSHHFNK